MDVISIYTVVEADISGCFILSILDIQLVEIEFITTKLHNPMKP